jgi:3-phenylpropionate/trans-cinnamate dioxygenase ferredoxin component
VTWAQIMSTSDLVDGGGVRVDLDEHRIAVFKVGDAVYAIGDRCSHAEASLSEGELFDNEIECPRHGAVFDIMTGKALALPATAPVPSYPVKVEDGAVYVEVDQP